MALRLFLFHPNSLSSPQRSNLLTSNPTFSHFNTKTNQISCSSSNLNDAELASEFANQVEKINTQQLQREKAMEKSREILFREMCNYFDLNEEEMKRKWESMNEDEKWVFVKGFVSDWGEFFYPLSVKCVKDMVEEHLEDEGFTSGVSDSILFSGFKKFWGF